MNKFILCKDCGTIVETNTYNRKYCSGCYTIRRRKLNLDTYYRHRDTALESKRKYHAANREKETEYMRRYRETHREQIREYNQQSYRRLYLKNPEMYIIRKHQRRTLGYIGVKQIAALANKQEHCCYYCRAPFFNGTLHYEYHIEHKTPVSRGGNNDISNIVLACPECNTRKGTLTAEEFAQVTV